MKKSIYLLPIENGTYTACVGCVIPQKSAIVLTTEESYPASISIIEYDAYGAGRIYQKIVSNQTELVDCLCECGKQYCAIAKLWNFDIDQNIPKSVGDLFDRAYHARLNGIRNDNTTNGVYLVSGTHATYQACVSSLQPSVDAIFLMEEPKYPVTLFNFRLDVNGAGTWDRVDVSSQEELLTALNFLGQCDLFLDSVYYDFDGDNPIKLFSLADNTTKELKTLCDYCYDKRNAE
jgi:hypothetical protein